MKKLIITLCFLLLFVAGCTKPAPKTPVAVLPTITVESMPKYDGHPYTMVNGNVPFFTKEDLARGNAMFEEYSPKDALGRCGVAFARVGKDTMPTEDRGKIGMVKPSGWKTLRFNNVDGKYLYNRCHLIAYCLAGENANDKNLITGTRAFNVDGMLPFETQTARYIDKTNHHVLYRVTPIYKGNELVARGVLMEAQSLEDNNLAFNVFVHNVQPGITINYMTGDATDGKETNDDKAIKKSIERHKKKVKQ